jgi:hypothetical protein
MKPCRFPWLLLLALSTGCSRSPAGRSPSPERADADAESAVRAQFKELQAAYKARDAERIWGLIASQSQAEAETQAKVLRGAWEKADAGERARMEKDEGLSAGELARLTGKEYLRTTRFHHKQDEVAGSAVERVTVGDDRATVYYLEQDGDHEKMNFFREEGQWKAWITIRKVQAARKS